MADRESLPESTPPSVEPISQSALVAGGGHSLAELGRDLRSVAAQAADDWSRAAATADAERDPEDFGRQVAKVYLAALRELNAGFAPDAECPGGRA